MSKTLTVYTFKTPNGLKLPIMLEELGLEYDLRLVDISKGEQKEVDYLQLNPNGKIPTIVDHDLDPALPVFESGAELLYLAEKHGQLIPTDPHGRSRTIQWLFFQNASFGPYVGQFVHFTKHPSDGADHPYGRERYTQETKRILGVYETRLQEAPYLAGEKYTIADVTTYPWFFFLLEKLGAAETLDLTEENHPQLLAWYHRIRERAAVQKAHEVLFGAK